MVFPNSKFNPPNGGAISIQDIVPIALSHPWFTCPDILMSVVGVQSVAY
jgi:hypothetical protein